MKSPIITNATKNAQLPESVEAGWDYREDAKDDAAELKEAGIPHKIVSRRFLVQQGIDPNAESSWKKNRQ